MFEPIWQPRQTQPISPDLTNWLTKQNIPQSFIPVLASRGVTTIQQADQFLYGTLTSTTSSILFGTELVKGVKRLQRAFQNREKILVFGDYDVDGTTGATVIMTVLKRMQSHYGFSFDCMIPDRFTEGYGLNPKNIGRVLQYQPNLVITVDCGISSGAEIAELKRQYGIDTIVTDHHEPKADTPTDAVAVIHPKYCNYPFQGLSGCGVAYQFMCGLWEISGKIAPEWVKEDLLDLVALGAVCDIMPLRGDNRIYVREGMFRIFRGDRLAFKLLGERMKWKKVDTYTLGFQIGPRLNAAGRMEDADIVVRLLLSDNPNECNAILDELERRNNERKKEQEYVVSEGLKQMEQSRYNFVTVVSSESFHEGVVGIAASKLIEQNYRPAFVLTDHGDTLKGSARSINGIHLFELIQRHEHLLQAWGGHAAAAGLIVAKENVQAFFDCVESDLSAYPAETFQKVHHYDGEIGESDLTDSFFNTLAKLEPFGQDFPPVTWKVVGKLTDWKNVHDDVDKRIGKFRVGNKGFPFAMWENAMESMPERDQVYYGRFEWSEFWKTWQFRALWAAEVND